MPDELAGIAVPIQPIGNRSVSCCSKNLLPAVLLRNFKGLVGINFEESRVEDLRGGIVGIVVVFASRIDSPRRCVLRIATGPGIRLHTVPRRGSEGSAPYRSLSVLTG